MEDTQKYLNSILQKRLGSIVNQNALSKNAHTVTRLPRKQQKLQSMPTVFRKKQQTIYRPNSQSYQSQSRQPQQSQARNSNYNYNVKNTSKQSQYQTQIINQQWEQQYDSAFNKNLNMNKPPKQSQRVQYMLISKRIENIKEMQKAPMVDVSKYHQAQIQQYRQKQREKTKYLIPDLNSRKKSSRDASQIDLKQRQTIRISQNNYKTQEIEPSKVVNPRRKKIFGNKSQSPDKNLASY